MNVSIVIPNFNGEALIEKNLPSVLAAKENPKNQILEIIIVDDGSWDGSVNLVKTKFPEVKLIKHKVNRGFSAAINTGARAATGDLILLLNTDVIPDINFLEPVIPLFKNPKVFAVTLHEKGYGWAMGYFGDGFVQLAPGEEIKETHISFYVSGGSGVFKRKVWRQLQGMDEKLLSPFYWEDIDLCYRAAKRGYQLLWEPKAHVTHKHESTISKFPKAHVSRIRERNQLLFIWKNIYSPNLIRRHIIEVIARVLRHPGYLKVVIMALLRIRIALKERRKEKRQARVSDEAIFARF